MGIRGGRYARGLHGIEETRVPRAVGTAVDVNFGGRRLRRWTIGRKAARWVQMTIDRETKDEAANQMSIGMASGIDQHAKEREIVGGAQMCGWAAQRRLYNRVEGCAEGSTISQQLEASSTPRRNTLALADDEANSSDKICGQAKIRVVCRVREARGRLEESELVATMPTKVVRTHRAGKMHSLLA